MQEDCRISEKEGVGESLASLAERYQVDEARKVGQRDQGINLRLLPDKKSHQEVVSQEADYSEGTGCNLHMDG